MFPRMDMHTCDLQRLYSGVFPEYFPPFSDEQRALNERDMATYNMYPAIAPGSVIPVPLGMTPYQYASAMQVQHAIASQQFMHEMMRNAYAVQREREAESYLASGVGPDWAAWSALMAEVPL